MTIRTMQAAAHPPLATQGDNPPSSPDNTHPPALVTAAARAGPAATFIPAREMGCLRPKSSVKAVLIFCSPPAPAPGAGPFISVSWSGSLMLYVR